MKYITLTKTQLNKIAAMYSNDDEQIIIATHKLTNGDSINLIVRKDRYESFINIRLYWSKSNLNVN